MFQFQEYPLTFSGEIFSGLYLGSNVLADSMRLKKKVEHLIQNFDGTGNLTDHVRCGFEESESEADTIEYESETSDEDKCGKKSLISSTPMLKRSRRMGDEACNVFTEIARNQSLLSSIEDSEHLVTKDTEVTHKDDEILLEIKKKLSK